MSDQAVVLVHPETARRIDLSFSDSQLLEDQSDARYLRVDGPTLTRLEFGSPARAQEALVVRADELMSSGFERVEEAGRPLHRRLAHLSPWKDWIAIEKNPPLLLEYWAGFSAPAELVKELLASITGITTTPSALLLERGEVEIECALPLQPEALERVPALLLPLVCVHAKIATNRAFSAGWYPSDLQFDPEEFGVSADAFHFLTAKRAMGFIAGQRVELLEGLEPARVSSRTVPQLILERLLRAPSRPRSEG
jgi:hypothetical protein